MSLAKKRDALAAGGDAWRVPFAEGAGLSLVNGDDPQFLGGSFGFAAGIRRFSTPFFVGAAAAVDDAARVGSPLQAVGILAIVLGVVGDGSTVIIGRLRDPEIAD